MLLFISNQIFAHKLIYENSDARARVATGVYLDEETGQVVVKKYTWDSEFEKGRTSRVQIKFPEKVRSFSSMYSSINESYGGLQGSQKFISLNRTSRSLKRELEKIVDDKSSKFSSQKTLEVLKSKILKSSPFEVVAHKKRGSNHKIFLLNSSTGEFYIKEGRKSDLSIEPKIAFPEDLESKLYDSDSGKFNLSSPTRIDRSLSKIKRALKRARVDSKEISATVNKIHSLKEAQKKKIEQMQVIRSIKDGDEIRELLFNFETGEFYYRRIEDGKVYDDEFYSINNDKNLDDLKSKLKRADLYDENEFEETFSDTFIKHCEGDSSLDDLLPNIDGKIEDILKVNDALWDDYLENSLSKKPVILNDGSMVMGINTLGSDHNVKIKLDSLGNIENLSFLNKRSADRAGIKVVEVIENGKKLFKIINSKSKDDLFFFDIENHNEGKIPVTANLAVYVKGKKGKDKVSRNMFDKNIYPISIANEKFTSVSSRIQLSSKRESPYPRQFSEGESKGFKSFVFNTFFSLEGKREKLADEIRTAANKQRSSINKDGRILLKDSEIHSTVLQVVSDVEQDIPRLDAPVRTLTAKTFEHSYKRFVSIIVPRMIKDLMPGQSEQFYKEIADKSMIGLKDCLERASKQSNSDASAACMSTYMTEAPVLIGEELLKFQLISNDQEVLSIAAVAEYNKCVKEFYDKDKKIDYIKGCIYRATFQSIDHKLQDVVELSLNSMEEDYKKKGKDISFILSSKALKTARKSLRSCYEKRGYIKPSIFSDSYQMSSLNKLSTEDFKQELFSCVSQIEQVVGREVSSTLVDTELSKMTLDQEVKNKIKETVLNNGYDHCVEAQRKQVEILAKSNIWRKVDVKKCASFVTVVATSIVVNETIEDKLGDELWRSLSSKEESPHMKCFEKLENKTLKNSLAKEPEDINVDLESAKCLKEGIVWASYYLGAKELEKTFKSDKLYRKVNLTDQKEDKYAKELQKCFEKELSALNSVSTVSSSLNKIQDKCTVHLIMGKTAEEDILGPVIEGMLEDQNISEGIISKTKGNIISSMKERVNIRLKTEALSLKEVVDEFKKVQGAASYYVADATVDQYVSDMIPDSDKANSISLDLRQKLFNGESGYRNKFLKANSSQEIKGIVQDLTRDAAINLTQVVTREEGIKLKNSGLLKTDQEVENLAKKAKGFMASCLDTFNGEGKFGDHVQKCVLSTKTSVTYGIFKDQVSTILNDSEYSKLLSDEDKELLQSELINPNFKDEITSAYETDSLSNLKDNFTLNATSSIASKVIEASITKLLLKGQGDQHPKYQEKIALSKQISGESIKELNSCLDLQKEELEKNKKGINTSLCINKSRLKATELVFEDILSNFTGYFEFDEEEKKLLVKNHTDSLKKCSLRNGESQKGKAFSDGINSCLIETIFDYVRNSTLHVSKKSPTIANIKLNDLNKYNGCIEEAKRNVVKRLQGLGVNQVERSTLYSKIDNREEFWDELFKKNIAGSSQEQVNWAIKVVQKCALTKVVPLAIDSILSDENLKSKLSLKGSEVDFANDLIDKLKSFSNESFESGLWLDLSVKKDPLTTPTVPTASSKTDGESTSTPTVNEDKSVENYLNKFLPLIGDYLKKIHAYDPKGAKKAMDSLILDIKNALKTKGKLSLDDLKNILMKSDFIDIVIMSEISSFIAKEARAPLLKEGVSLSDINKLSSKKILGPLFSSRNPKGKKALEDIKREFVKPLLDGEKLKAIPAHLVKDVKVVLTEDRRIGGFVETIAGSIIQNNLDKKRPGNVATQGIAGLMGYNHRDFSWKHLRGRVEPGVAAKDQPVQKALEYFGSSILKPILLKQKLGTRTEYGIFSNTKIDILEERKETFTEKVKGLMDLPR